MDNTPKLMQSEEKRAPWNEKTKIIEVNISQCLSSTERIEVPEDFEDYDNKEALEDFVRDQIMLPSDCVENNGYWWYIDDFCVSI
jgi:hypothetical protein